MLNINDFRTKKQKNEKIKVITSYDYSTAVIVNESDIDAVLVGDSLGMVFCGYETTIPVTPEEMIYHTKAVKRGAADKFIITDLPYLSYHVSDDDTLQICGKIFKESGCHAVKLEGGSEFSGRIKLLTNASIPVMGHLGLTPQSVHKFGGFKVQGRDDDKAEKMISDAKSIENAGAFAIVLEAIPEKLAALITQAVSIPTIGIGAGRYVDGQVLVINDLLGYNRNFNPRFVRKYRNYNDDILNALNEYCEDVDKQIFPAEENSFK
ncbi:MAG: 3-methyl-2-oxobutanoate hydroxymethyltransferase [Spirochaetes bacterium]|nr:3-methyl-2-oxobutanoate hydroxymethyltransferase [Spirochaetota bacterium]